MRTYPRRFMVRNAAGEPLELGDHWLGQACILIGGGPSLRRAPLDDVRDSGILTMAMNNAWSVYRPHLWCCVDPASGFLDAGWRDPRILKFAPDRESKRRLRARRPDGSWRTLGLTPGRCPATAFYPIGGVLQPATFLAAPTVSIGAPGDTRDRAGVRGSRSVMLAALRLLYWLGIRRVYLLGADFRMDSEGEHYASGDSHEDRLVRHNNRTYAGLRRRFEALRPEFERAGLRVVNCTQGSELAEFERADIRDVLTDEAIPSVEGADARGWCAKHTTDREPNH